MYNKSAGVKNKSIMAVLIENNGFIYGKKKKAAINSKMKCWLGWAFSCYEQRVEPPYMKPI